jgi:hypothetical protein
MIAVELRNKAGVMAEEVGEEKYPKRQKMDEEADDEEEEAKRFWKLEPMTVTFVPPVTGPRDGSRRKTEGRGRNVKKAPCDEWRSEGKAEGDSE